VAPNNPVCILIIENAFEEAVEEENVFSGSGGGSSQPLFALVAGNVC